MNPQLRRAAGAAAPASVLALVAAPAHAAAANPFNTGDTAWMLVATVLVLLMTVPGIMLFYGGMARQKNVLSIIAHTLIAAAVVTLVWIAAGYSLAFTPGNEFVGGLERVFGSGLVGSAKGHPSAPTIPEPLYFTFELAFAIITFALIIGATVERMPMSATAFFAAFWSLLVYAPVAHWVWHPGGWLAKMGHMDFAGGTVVHVAAGVSGVVAALIVGPRQGFGRAPMVPYNLVWTSLGTGLLWAGWFGFNAGSAGEAGARAAGALLATQVAPCAAAIAWGLCDFVRRQQVSVLGLATGVISGLVAVTPASGYVGLLGATVIGFAAGIVCYLAVSGFKSLTGVDDTLDVFAIHGVAGLLGTALTPLLALPEVAPVTSTLWVNAGGALAIAAYAAVGTGAILLLGVRPLAGLRVSVEAERLGLDAAEHGELASSS